MNFDNLKQLPIDQLKTLAAQHNVRVHHKMKAEKIAQLIAQAVTEPQINKKADELKHSAQLPKQPSKINTEEEIREVCQKFFSKEGYQVTFKDDTWHFKFAGAEDSGHMSVPLRIIRMKAENVSRGARKPVMMSFDGERILAAG